MRLWWFKCGKTETLGLVFVSACLKEDYRTCEKSRYGLPTAEVIEKLMHHHVEPGGVCWHTWETDHFRRISSGYMNMLSGEASDSLSGSLFSFLRSCCPSPCLVLNKFITQLIGCRWGTSDIPQTHTHTHTESTTIEHTHRRGMQGQSVDQGKGCEYDRVWQCVTEIRHFSAKSIRSPPRDEVLCDRPDLHTHTPHTHTHSLTHSLTHSRTHTHTHTHTHRILKHSSHYLPICIGKFRTGNLSRTEYN